MLYIRIVQNPIGKLLVNVLFLLQRLLIIININVLSETSVSKEFVSVWLLSCTAQLILYHGLHLLSNTNELAYANRYHL